MGQTEWSTLVESICAERGLSVVLSWDMPQGYETANGTFDPVAKTLFLNPAALRQLRDCWRPKRIWSNEDYRRLFREIDERIENSAR